MQKIYNYNPERYKFKVVYTGFFLIAIAAVLTVLYVMNPTQFLYLFGIGGSLYGAINTFVFKSNPKSILIDDETITFQSFGETKYKINELERFVIREFANAQFYIRVADKNGTKGRYWVSYYYFFDREEMIDELYVIEKRIHPSNIKFRGRDHMFNIRKCNQEEVVVREIDEFFDDAITS